MNYSFLFYAALFDSFHYFCELSPLRRQSALHCTTNKESPPPAGDELKSFISTILFLLFLFRQLFPHAFDQFTQELTIIYVVYQNHFLCAVIRKLHLGVRHHLQSCRNRLNQQAVVIDPEFRNADALRGLEDFTHIWLIWGFSANEVNMEADPVKWSPTVRPRCLL